MGDTIPFITSRDAAGKKTSEAFRDTKLNSESLVCMHTYAHRPSRQSLKTTDLCADLVFFVRNSCISEISEMAALRQIDYNEFWENRASSAPMGSTEN